MRGYVFLFLPSPLITPCFYMHVTRIKAAQDAEFMRSIWPRHDILPTDGDNRDGSAPYARVFVLLVAALQRLVMSHARRGCVREGRCHISIITVGQRRGDGDNCNSSQVRRTYTRTHERSLLRPMPPSSARLYGQAGTRSIVVGRVKGGAILNDTHNVGRFDGVFGPYRRFSHDHRREKTRFYSRLQTHSAVSSCILLEKSEETKRKLKRIFKWSSEPGATEPNL
jgi:hypothetical protein